MTAPNPMTRKELLELAALDALGLLDEYEATLYTRSFHLVPPAVQEELMQLQASIATDPSLLHPDEPDAALRERVLDAVSRSMEQELAPIATIGRRPGAVAADSEAVIAGRIGFAGTTLAWRVATFALCGMVVVFAYFLAISVQRHHELTRWVLDSNTSAQIEQFLGRTFKDYLFDETTTKVVFKSAEQADVRAILLITEDANRAMLVTEGLPEGNGLLQLVARDADGNTHVVAAFEGRTRLAANDVDVSRFASLQNVRWEIIGSGNFRLASA